MEWGSRLREGRKGTFSIPTGGNYGGKEEGEEGEEEDSSEEEHEEVEPARASTKPVRVARASRRQPSPGFRRQPGADKNAIIVDLDENAIARQLLELIDFGPPPGVK